VFLHTQYSNYTYNISGVNVAIVALNCFVNYAKEGQSCMEIEECVDSLHSNIGVVMQDEVAPSCIIQQLMTR
jgi:hypothetical protein